MRVRSIKRFCPPVLMIGGAALFSEPAPAEGLPVTVLHQGQLYLANGEGPLSQDIPPAASAPPSAMAGGDEEAREDALAEPYAASAGGLSIATGPGISCNWVTGPSCTLGSEPQSSCMMTASCPSGTKVVSGGCEGFTSVAIGRSTPNVDFTAWTCAVVRLYPIKNPNKVAAQALCCSY